MHDQNSIDAKKHLKSISSVRLVYQSVLKPDHDLRGCAYNQGCYDDLMEIRKHVLEYLKTLKKLPSH